MRASARTGRIANMCTLWRNMRTVVGRRVCARIVRSRITTTCHSWLRTCAPHRRIAAPKHTRSHTHTRTSAYSIITILLRTLRWRKPLNDARTRTLLSVRNSEHIVAIKPLIGSAFAIARVRACVCVCVICTIIQITHMRGNAINSPFMAAAAATAGRATARGVRAVREQHNNI